MRIWRSLAGAGPLENLARAMLPEGHGLPGAERAGAATLLVERTAGWRPRLRWGFAALVWLFELTPLASRHLRPFSLLGPAERSAWVERCHRSRWALRRNHLTALKQMLFMQWATAPEVESALGFDYTCLADGRPRGTTGSRPAAGVDGGPEPEPPDLHRAGPAQSSGAVPVRLLQRRTFERHDDWLETRSWPDLGGRVEERAQVVVIGSGAGGAVVAATLAEAGVDVLVLEEGPQVAPAEDFVGSPLDRIQRFCRDDASTFAWGNPPISMPVGRVVGGTTVVNSGTCFRAPRRVLDRWWTENGVDSAAPGVLDPYYDAVEDFLNVRPVEWRLLGDNGAAAHRGASALGMTGGPLLRNIADCHGCGQCAFGCPTGAKQAMHVSYLPRAWRAGARIFSNCRVERIETSKGRAAGVRAAVLDDRGHRSGTLVVRADRVVVSAGTLSSPVLLARSDVPDPSGQTGRNLRIHPATTVAGWMGEGFVNWRGTLQSYFIDSLFDSHELMFEATTAVPSVAAGQIGGVGVAAMEQLGILPEMATLGFLVSDTSKGRVRALVGGEPLATYRLNQLDARRISIGLATAAEVLLAAGAKEVQVGVPQAGTVSSSAELERLRTEGVRRHHLKLSAFHPMGTVRMGADPQTAVVDPAGRHHAVRDLWVVDASTFPTCVAVNPQMTIMALAKRSAELLAAGL